MNVSVYGHVGYALGASGVLVVVTIELYPQEVLGVFSGCTRVEGVTEGVEFEEFRPQRDACTHVILGGTAVVVV